MRNFLKNSTLVVLSSLFVLTSCENDPVEDDRDKDIPEYFPLAVGNYWIYDVYNIDENGNEQLLNLQDTLAIVKDSIIDGKVYFVQKWVDSRYSSFGGIRIREQFIRKSSDCILQYNHLKYPHFQDTILSYTNFTDILLEIVSYEGNTIFDPHDKKDTLYTVSFKMENPETVRVPAGSFEAVDFRGTYFVHEKYLHPDLPNPRYIHNYYADRIGLLLKTEDYYTSLARREWRLSKYHIVSNSN